MHNMRVISPCALGILPTDRAERSRAGRRMARAAAGFAAGAVAVALLAGCGGEEASGEPSASPTPTAPVSGVTVPDGIELTAAGAELGFGDPATVAYEPNAQRNTVMELSVLGVKQGTIADLGGYVLDEKTKASTPYYVSVRAANVGEGNVGQSPIPLWAVDDTNTLIQASSFANSFRACPSKPLPAKFGPGAKIRTCLVYLVPDHGELTGVSFRPLQAFAPIVWTGEIEKPAKGKKNRKKAAS